MRVTGGLMTFAEYMALFRLRWRWLLLGVVVGLLGALAVNLFAPKQYTATTQLYVRVSNETEAQGANYQDAQFAVARVASYVELGSNPGLLDRVSTEKGLDLTSAEMASRLKISSPPETVLLDVSFSHGDPEQAALIADAISAELGQVVSTLETRPGATEPSVVLAVVESAGIPSTPSSPRPKVNFIIGFLAGLALGVVLALTLPATASLMPRRRAQRRSERRAEAAEEPMNPQAQSVAPRSQRRAATVEVVPTRVPRPSPEVRVVDTERAERAAAARVRAKAQQSAMAESATAIAAGSPELASSPDHQAKPRPARRTRPSMPD